VDEYKDVILKREKN